MNRFRDIRIKIKDVEVPVWIFLVFGVGGFFGIALCYFWLARLPFWTDPLIGNAVKATVAAQPTYIPPGGPSLPTHTPAPTYTLMPTFTPYPTPEPTQAPPTCADYGIRIVSPEEGADVGGQLEVTGSYESEPPEDSLYLVNKKPGESLYWPSTSTIQIDKTLMTWHGEAYINGEAPLEEEILIVIVGKPGRILLEYYFAVGRATYNWQAIEILTDDIMVCDQITVVKTRE